MMLIRCSSLPLLRKCSASLTVEGVRIDPHDDSSTLGTAIHAALAELIERGEAPDLGAIAERFEIADQDLPDLEALYHMGAKIWREHLSEHFPDPSTELEVAYYGIGDVRLLGHIDVASSHNQKLRIIDWKTGRVERDYRAQVTGYALAANQTCGPFVEITATVAFLRTGNYRTLRWTPEELDKHGAEMVRGVVDGKSTFRPGDHCEHCPAFAACPARQAMVKDSLAIVGDLPDSDLPTVVSRSWGKIQLIEQSIERFKKQVRQHVAAYGPLSIGEGKRLTLEPVERTEIDTLKAWEIVTSQLGGDELAGVLTIGKGDLEDAIRAKAPRGKKGEAVKDLFAQLADVGALTKTTAHRLTVSDEPPKENGLEH